MWLRGSSRVHSSWVRWPSGVTQPTQKFEDRMKSAGDNTGSAFANLEARINKSTALANDAVKCLDMGGSKIAQQHDAVLKALEEMNKNIEDTRTELNSDSANTRTRRKRGPSSSASRKRCKGRLLRPRQAPLEPQGRQGGSPGHLPHRDVSGPPSGGTDPLGPNRGR